ncbi:nucleotidyltransferase family protein [bacterium]|nr:nucleotidyltransferase family protein [bacterium]
MVDSEPVFRYLLNILDDRAEYSTLSERVQHSSEQLLSLARKLKIAPWMARMAIEQWGSSFPKEVLDILSAEFERNKQRSAALLLQVRNIAELMDKHNIPVIFLKGAAVLIRGFFPFGYRFMADIDLLVHAGDAAECDTVLRSAGYGEIRESIRQVHHAPLLKHPDGAAAVEIHTEPYPMLPGTWTWSQSMWENAWSVNLWGVPALVPSDTDHAWILMRSDPLNRPYLPRLNSLIELAYLIDSGGILSYEIIHDRAIYDMMPGIFTGMQYACSRYFGIICDRVPDVQELEKWESWCVHVLRQWNRKSWLSDARDRFTAYRFYSSRGIRSRIRFLIWMLRSIGYIDRFQPGEDNEPSLPKKVFRWMKVLAGLVFIGTEYLTFMLRKSPLSTAKTR